MIVTCPNCGASYRIAEALVAGGARMRCAACDHRWAVAVAPPPRVTEADEDAAFAEVQAAVQARRSDGAWPVGAPVVDSGAGETAAGEPEAGTGVTAEVAATAAPPRILRTVIAMITGVALAIVAAGLWIGRADLAALPIVGPALGRFDTASPLRVSAAGVVTELASGRRVLEVTGTVSNPGPGVAKVAPLAATLAGPDGVAVRWRIPAPVARLAPGQQVAFATTATGFPDSARQLSVRVGE